MVKIALEPVIALLSRTAAKPEWKDIKVWLKKDDFIKSVMNFDKNDISPPVKTFVMKTYLKDDKTFDT